MRVAHETGRCVETETADLSDKVDLARVERLVTSDPNVSLLVNNAGLGAPAPLRDSDVEELARMIDVNVTAVMRLTVAIVPRFLGRGEGAIINVGSVLGIAPEGQNAVYGGKSFVLGFGLSLHKELVGRGIRVQAVLPGAAAALWERTRVPLPRLPPQSVMDAGDLVDAALVGFDRGELVTIPMQRRPVV
jgi:short-subunit dehydrogenase